MANSTMEHGAWLLLMVVLLLFLISSVPMVMGNEGEGGEEEGESKGKSGGDLFLLKNSKQVMKSEAGEFIVVKGDDIGKAVQKPMHIGFISMEPMSLFIPQYLDSSLIIFIRRGAAKIGWINKDEFVEKNLKMGDLYQIPAGFPFYIVNAGVGQKLQIICSIDPSESLTMDVLQSFFIGGGIDPPSVLAGFDRKTLAIALNVSSSELDEIMSSKRDGSIRYLTDDAHGLRRWASLKQQERLDQRHGFVNEDDKSNDKGYQNTWTWRKFLNYVLGKKSGKKTRRGPDSYNLYDRKPGFKNDYGWSIAVDEDDYSPLSHSDFGVYYVNLSAGSMMLPHINPTASEYGIVTRGSGSIQVVNPNGTLAMNKEVNEGDVFLIPRYFPFCQIASSIGPMEFFGFTTSAKKNWPQFLVGATSILRTMNRKEVAMSFGLTEEGFNEFINAQNGSIIVTTVPVAVVPPKQQPHKTSMDDRMVRLGKRFGADMIMGN